MATAGDESFLRTQLNRGHVGASVLEVGSRDWQAGEGNMSRVIVESGRSWEGCDITTGPGVDFVLDLLDDAAVAAEQRRWQTVLVFNVLEHVYDPISALRNAVSLVENGGNCILCGPAIWELHAFPADYWRPQPDFFDEFSRRERLALLDLSWVLQQWAYLPGRQPRIRVIPVDELRDRHGRQAPGRLTASQTFGWFRSRASIGVQRALNLTGRSSQFPKTSIGAVLRKQ